MKARYNSPAFRASASEEPSGRSHVSLPIFSIGLSRGSGQSGPRECFLKRAVLSVFRSRYCATTDRLRVMTVSLGWASDYGLAPATRSTRWSVVDGRRASLWRARRHQDYRTPVRARPWPRRLWRLDRSRRLARLAGVCSRARPRRLHGGDRRNRVRRQGMNLVSGQEPGADEREHDDERKQRKDQRLRRSRRG